ncbi:MAG: hypothetical protein ACNS62_05435 [Candidatus Cyclobacteriaceae bacterium M3_2C_046]
MEKICLECGCQIWGRSDKKFCGDQCRTTYNNRQNNESNQLVRKINYTLKKNRKILATLKPYGKSKIPRRRLIDLGFDFNYHTNIFTTKGGNTYYFCYDHGYLEVNQELVAVVIRKDFVVRDNYY